MDNWLKWMVTAACCVVIAGGGLWSYEKYSAWAAEKDAENQEALFRCHAVIAYAKNRTDGEPVPALLFDRVLESASSDELHVRITACAEMVPEFVNEAARLKSALDAAD